MKSATIYAVGLGPGSSALMTPQAREVLERCTTIAGYRSYLDQIPEFLEGKQIICSGMRQETERCRAALEAARKGESVAVVSSGDAGIYGMAGLLLELLESGRYPGIEVAVVPGITAASAAAARVGAPLMCDFCVISLSDLLADGETIRRRVRCAAENDFVTVLYNPGSSKRRELLEFTVGTFRRAGGESLPVAVVHNAFRSGERFSICTIAEFPFAEIDMTTILIIGSSSTVVRNGRMYTLRGYREKYDGFQH